MIEYKNYFFQYDGAENQALKNINLEVESEKVVLLTGRSGCGKTTLIRSLNRLIPHFYAGTTTGALNLDGQSLLKVVPADLVGKIGSVFQDPRSQFFMTDTTQELAFGCQNLGFHQDELIQKVLQSATELKLTQYLDRSIFHLSSGEKQQIAIGSIYALAPDIYIFDEPSANLDYQAIQRLSEVMQELKNKGCTIFIVEHRFYYLREMIDCVYLIEDGEIIRTMTQEVFCQLSRHEREAYGLRTPFPEKEYLHLKKGIQKSNTGLDTLMIDHIAYGYKRQQSVLKDVSVCAKSGDVIGILGENGAGKTTLLSVLTGLTKQQNGKIKFNDKTLNQKRRQKLSSMVMQDADYQLFSNSVADELCLGITRDCQKEVDEVLKYLDLYEYRDRHPASLSGGQKQRVTIGAAIIKNSKLIYFDEPTSGLDFDGMERVSQLIKKIAEAGKIIFIVSHDFEFISRTCTKVLMLENGTSEDAYPVTAELLNDLAEKFLGR